MTQVSSPSHIDPARIVPFDIFQDPRRAADGNPFAMVSRLRAEGAPGMFWTPMHGGHWVIQDFELAFDAVRDPDLFSSFNTRIPASEVNPSENNIFSIPITLDPPQHGQYRLPLQAAFSPKAINALENDIRLLAAELIDAVADKGNCDFFETVADPLPVTVFMKFMGLPLERKTEFRAMVKNFIQGVVDPVAAVAHRAAILAEVDAVIAERRKQPREDLVSRLLIAEVDGRPVTNDEIRGYCLLLIVAGLDTVANAMGFGIRHLACDQEMQQSLRDRPELIPEAMEELLRRYSVAQISRRVSRDAEWKGLSLKKNDRVLVLLSGANTDPKQFPDPERVDVARENKTHIIFNAGPHRCIGSHLARLELRILYEEWLKRIPTFRVDPDKAERFHASQVFGPDHMPLVWDAAAR